MLEYYQDIVDGKEKAKYLSTDLKYKAKRAEGIFHDCHFCERRCHVDRGKQSGYCRVQEARIASKFLHMGEERPLVPSFTIFFSGCTLRCFFCQNWDISQDAEAGVGYEPRLLAMEIDGVEAKNVNWVGGEPTPNIPFIIDVLKHCKRSIPQIWNSNMYMTEDSMGLLDGIVDVYLSDFKYGNDKCAKRFSDANNYFNIVSRNHKIANGQTEMIIRHLALPNHIECCTKPILDWISESLDLSRVVVNVMDQYRPDYKAMEFGDIARTLKKEEWLEAINYAKKLGLELI